MAEIRWTQEAATWLEDIFNYVASDDSEAARRTVQGIYEAVQNLKTFPRSGRLYSTTNEGEVRVVLHDHYRIAHLLRRDDSVVVLGIFHGALDIDRYL